MNANLPKYELLALSLQTLIESHEYPPGYKLPSIRQLSEQRRCSIETVQRALNLLEDRGLITPVAKSGVFVSDRSKLLTHSCSDPTQDWVAEEPLELNSAAQTAHAINLCMQPNVAPLGLAFPSPDLLPIATLRRCYQQACREHPNLLAQGSHVFLSLPNLTERLHQRFELAGMRIRQEEIVITEGCTEALALALQTVTNPGDVVAVESPGYYLLLQVIEKLGLRAVEIPCGEHGLCPDALTIAAQRNSIKACIVCPTASNPSGALMPDERREKLMSVAKKNDIVIIEDNIYSDLYWERYQPKPLKGFSNAGNVITCGSFSKSITPSLRMGYVAAGRFAKQMQINKRILSGSSNPLTQMALALYLKGGSYDRHIRTLRRQFETQVQHMSTLVTNYFPKGTRISRPKGGFVLWIELPHSTNTDKLLKPAIDIGTSFMPGKYFSATGLYANHMRINCGYPVNAAIERGVEKLGELLGKSS